MTAINQLGNALTGSTGSGNFVGANTPTLITPVLGAATATSINFGGSTLNTYTESGTWTPTFTFATPGNLSVVYTAQFGFYTRVGNQVTLNCRLEWTPTHTTASGNAFIGGIPFAAKNTSSTEWTSGNIDKSAFAFPTGTTSISVGSSSTLTFFVGTGTVTASAVFTITQFPTTVAQYVYYSFTYLV